MTGRPRRCGWFDAVLARQSVMLGGVEGVALTKLDVLDGLESLHICVGYRIGERELDYLPARVTDQASVTPIYEEMPGCARRREARGPGGICRRRRWPMCGGWRPSSARRYSY